MATGSGLAFALAFAIMQQDALPPPPVEPQLISPTTWLEPPSVTPDDYPRFASIVGITGEVQVACRVSIDGRPMGCRAVSARPSGLGFEPIAVEIVERGRLSPARDKSGPVESDFSVRVPFSISSDPFTAPAWEGPEPSPAQRAAGETYARRAILDPAYRSDARWGLQDLPTEMRDTVRGWTDELFREDLSFRTLSMSMARVLARRGLDRFPSEKPADWSDWVAELSSAKSDYFDAKAANAELRRRYCARYDCGPAVARP